MNDTIADPIIYRIEDTKDKLYTFQTVVMPAASEKSREIIEFFPVVYIHNWKEKEKYEVYVGESNDVIRRTYQHFDVSVNGERWQRNLNRTEKEPVLYIIGHEHFNKSLTLDVENRLMHYMMSVVSVKRIHNLRDNPQSHYYPSEEFEGIFSKIWSRLHQFDERLFPEENVIKDSAIFKASPLHKLTGEQLKAQELILKTVSSALRKNKNGRLVFVQGEAGTGKTVLNSSTFYELFRQAEKEKIEKEIYLLVNHDEQLNVYCDIADKLGINSGKKKRVFKPTTFINHHSSENPADVVFVDEAHLLLTQGKQSYTGKNQLEDILERAKVTVVMFDQNQILTTEQYWEAEQLEKYRKLAEKQGTYLSLNEQLRMHADKKVVDWIDHFTIHQELKEIPSDASGYEVKIFATPHELDNALIKKARKKETALSRIIATYDWKYSSKNYPSDNESEYWEVKIGTWHKPWNRELERHYSKEKKKGLKGLAWAEQPQTIGEVGSTFTIQGFDLNYAGVILGPSVKYRNGKIVFDPSFSQNEKAVRNRTLSNGEKEKFGELLLQHEVRVLMTRGVNGLYIYACDEELRKALLNAAETIG